MSSNAVIVMLVILGATSAKLFGQTPAGTVLWRYDLGGELINSSPALAPDGTIYLAKSPQGLCAITNSISAASNKWTFPTLGYLYRTPAIGNDGTIYFGSDYSPFYAINLDGSQKWAFPASSGASSPAIGFDGTIYFAADGKLYALSPSGSNRWTCPILGNNQSSPIIGADGTIYIGNGVGATLFAINPDGTLKWSFPFQGNNSTADSGAFGSDGTIYVGGRSLYAFTPSGSNLWAAAASNLVLFSSPSVGNDGTIYVVDYPTKSIYLVTRTGEIATNFLHAPDCGLHGACPRPATPAIDAGGNLYYSASNTIFALSKTGEVEWTIQWTWAAFQPAIPSPLIGPDGTIYAALGTMLYAIAGTNGPADSPWPMYRQNARRTGKVEKPALKQPQKRSDANFQFQLYGQLGQTFTVEASSNFNTWTSVTSFVANTLPMDVVDLSASNHPSRFYRASSPP
jgi:outer membrane protein assembly factor BamB